MAGVICGACVIAWAVLRDDVPTYLETWRLGAEGEHKTHKVLRSLGWHVVEDVQGRRGNYDHVVVGPAGVFLIETKNPTGIVQMRDGTPWLTRRHDPDGERPLRDVCRQARGSSAAIHEEIERRGGLREWVNAVVVFWCDFPEGIVEADKIVYVHGSKLRDWLTDRPEALDADRIASITGALAGLKAEGDIRAAQRRREA